MGKYDPLHKHLVDNLSRVNELTMNFAEIEKLVGHLPSSAHVHRTWWTRSTGAGAQAWLSAGWRVESVDLVGKRVVFSAAKAMSNVGNTSVPSPREMNIRGTPGAKEPNPPEGELDKGNGQTDSHTPCRALVGDLGIALVAAAAAGVSGIIGLTHLPLWALALLCAAAGAVGFAMSQAIISQNTADTARWWSISTLAVLAVCAGSFTYHKVFDTAIHPHQVYQFVVNGNDSNFIPLYGEAGGPEQYLATGTAGQNGLIGGQTYNFDCWTMGLDGAKWLRYERFGQTWWAANALVHSPPGEAKHTIPHC